MGRKTINTDVLIMGPDDFKEHFLDYLTAREKTPISISYNMQETFKSDQEGPKIVAEQQASYCTLILAFNEEGEAMILHWPLSTVLEPSGELPENIKGYIDKMKEFALTTHGHVLITGTNTMQSERDAVLKALHLDEIDNAIVVMTSDLPSKRYDVAPDVLANGIQGVCFVPKQLSTDSRNKIFLLAQRINKKEFEGQTRPADFLANEDDSKAGFKVEL